MMLGARTAAWAESRRPQYPTNGLVCKWIAGEDEGSVGSNFTPFFQDISNARNARHITIFQSIKSFSQFGYIVSFNARGSGSQQFYRMNVQTSGINVYCGSSPGTGLSLPIIGRFLVCFVIDNDKWTAYISNGTSESSISRSAIDDSVYDVYGVQHRSQTYNSMLVYDISFTAEQASEIIAIDKARFGLT